MRSSHKRILAALCGVALAAALIGSAQGTQTDPLVTMSYLNEVAGPAILKDVDAKLAEGEQDYADKLSELIRQYEAEIDAKLARVTGQTSFSSAAFSVVTLPAGQTLTGEAGCEFLLRAGSATCVAPSAPGLVDTTEGSTLDSGGAVQPNHLYLATDGGRGLRATVDVTLMVRGAYTIA